MPLTPEQYTGREDYSRFGASATGRLEAFLRKPPHKRSQLDYHALISGLIDDAADSGIELRP